MWPQRAQPANTYPPGLPGRTGHRPQMWGGDCLSLLCAAHSAALFLVTKCSASFWGEITAPQLCLHMVWVSGSEHLPPGLPGEHHGSGGSKLRSEGKIMAHSLFCKDFTHLKGCKKKNQRRCHRDLWPAKPKIFTICPCMETVCQNLLGCTMVGLGQGKGRTEADPRT